MSREDIFNGLGVEVELFQPEDFLKIKETLTRIGIASKEENTLTQSCHILHKRGRYAVMHFKEMFLLDGRKERTNFVDSDTARRNKIVSLLEEWKLLKVIDDEKLDDGPEMAMSQIKVIPFSDKENWNLVSKYNIGKKPFREVA